MWKMNSPAGLHGEGRVLEEGLEMLKIADRIVIDPQVCFGKPVVEGTRIPVHMVLELLGEGLTPQEIIEKCYPHLTKEDILACIRYANSLVKNEEIHVA
jgi:uncharacterized protein (DUF433 family)